MKKFFEEPKLCVEQFTVADTILGLSTAGGLDDELGMIILKPYNNDPIG